VNHGDDQGFVGMNPEKMQSLIGELRTAQHGIAAFAGEFSAPLSAQGISIGTVHQAEHWTADQISELTERLQKIREDEHTVPPRMGGQPGAQGVSPGSTTGSGTSSGPGTSGTGSGAGSDSAAPGGGYPSGVGAPAAPPDPYGHTASATTAAAGQPSPDAAKHAGLDAKRVSHAAQHSESLPDRVWDDIERNASDPQYAIAFFAALGAAGLAVLGASVAKSRKKDQDKKEADRRQAALDELLRNAGEYGTPAAAEPDGRSVPQQETGAPHLHIGQAQGQDEGPGTDAQPTGPGLRLVMAGSAPADQRPAGDPAAHRAEGS